MHRNQKIREEEMEASLSPPPLDKAAGGVGQSERKSRPVRHFPGMQKMRKGVYGFWQGIGKQVNDNTYVRTDPGSKLTAIFLFFMLTGVLATLNSSTIITQAVLHADDWVLATAMDINEDALAAALNEINVGE